MVLACRVFRLIGNDIIDPHHALFANLGHRVVVDSPHIVLLVEFVVQLTSFLRIVKNFLYVLLSFQFVDHLLCNQEFARFDEIDPVSGVTFLVKDVVFVNDLCFEVTGEFGQIGACEAGEKRDVFDEADSKLGMVVVDFVLGFNEVKFVQGQKMASGQGLNSAHSWLAINKRKLSYRTSLFDTSYVNIALIDHVTCIYFWSLVIKKERIWLLLLL